MDAPRTEIGRIWDGYAIESHLSDGANSSVYLVQDTRNKDYFAMKLFRRMDARRVLRIEQEATFARELRHKNIVRTLGVITVDDAPALLMEHIEGKALSDWLAEDNNADLEERLEIFRQIVDGCRYAHKQKIVHRDLKPSNVLLQPGRGGKKWIPRITDFGLAKALAPDVGKYGGLTTVNTGLGTVGYAAPEQVRDASNVDHRADLYSLGCILYELVCGLPPFAGLSAFDTLQAQSRSQYRHPEEMAPGLPPGLYDLIRQMMSVRPEARPNDTEEVLRRLDAVVDALGFAPVVPPPHERRYYAAVMIGSLCAVPVAFLVLGSIFAALL